MTLTPHKKNHPKNVSLEHYKWPKINKALKMQLHHQRQDKFKKKKGNVSMSLPRPIRGSGYIGKYMARCKVKNTLKPARREELTVSLISWMDGFTRGPGDLHQNTSCIHEV